MCTKSASLQFIEETGIILKSDFFINANHVFVLA